MSRNVFCFCRLKLLTQPWTVTGLGRSERGVRAWLLTLGR